MKKGMRGGKADKAEKAEPEPYSVPGREETEKKKSALSLVLVDLAFVMLSKGIAFGFKREKVWAFVLKLIPPSLYPSLLRTLLTIYCRSVIDQPSSVMVRLSR